MPAGYSLATLLYAPQCRMTVKGTSKYISDGSQVCKENSLLCLDQNVASTVGQVGIDNGKYCPDGSVVDAAANGLTAVVSNLQNVVYDPSARTLKIAGTMPAGYVNGLSLVSGLSAVMLGGLWIDDILANQVPGIETCRFRYLAPDPVIETGAAAIRTYMSFGSFYVTLPTSRAPPSSSDWIKLNVDLNGALGCSFNSPVTFPYTAPSASIKGMWSPACDTSYSFYSQFAVGSSASTAANTVFGSPCPRCGSAASPRLFQYNATLAGRFCSSPQVWGTSVQGSSSCIAVGVADYGPGSYKTGLPMVAGGLDGATMSFMTAFGTEAVFPTLRQVRINSEDCMPGNRHEMLTVHAVSKITR